MDMNEKPPAGPGPPDYSLAVLYCVCGILLIAIFLFDLAIPAGIAVGVLYVTVVLVSLWLPHRPATLAFATVSSVLILAALLFKPPAEDIWKTAFNRGISLFAVWVIALLGLMRKRMEEQRNTMLLEREKALREVKILSGLLPICASCKRIKDETGTWTQIEGYIKKHSEAEFTHGICPECAERLYPDIFKKIVK